MSTLGVPGQNHRLLGRLFPLLCQYPLLTGYGERLLDLSYFGCQSDTFSDVGGVQALFVVGVQRVGHRASSPTESAST
jgi:hypothetical protein